MGYFSSVSYFFYKHLLVIVGLILLCLVIFKKTIQTANQTMVAIHPIDETIILNPQDTIKAAHGAIKLRLKGCGRAFVSDGKHFNHEKQYCDLLVIAKDGTETLIGHNPEPVYVGQLRIRITGINSWGRQEHGIPAGGCQVHIATAPAVLFLAQYEKQAKTWISSESMSVPKQGCVGLPYALYANASTKIGFDLNTLAGKTVEIQIWELNIQEKKSGGFYRAALLVDENKVLTGWIIVPKESRPGSGIHPLNLAILP